MGAPVQQARGGISVRGIAKRFGAVAAVDHVDLDLPAGSFFSLLGPSGCGKTTLMRIIAGLERPDVGVVLADGQDITRHPPERRPFNMVFQRYALFPHLTVAENLAFGLTTDRRTRPPEAEIRRRVGEMLELVGLSGFDGRYPSQMSGGQQQRVAVARALIRRPAALLLDEPMSALDRNVRHQVREELKRIHGELGTTFVLVTHDQEEALSISDTIGLMHEGRLAQVATPENLYHHPASLFAARFVGAGSFIDGRGIMDTPGHADVEVGGIRFLASSVDPLAGRAVHVLLRPEDLVLVDPGQGRIDGHVESSAFYGAFHEVTVRTALGPLRLRRPTPAPVGTAVAVSWPERAGIAYPVSSSDGPAAVPAADEAVG